MAAGHLTMISRDTLHQKITIEAIQTKRKPRKTKTARKQPPIGELFDNNNLEPDIVPDACTDDLKNAQLGSTPRSNTKNRQPGRPNGKHHGLAENS